MSNNNNKSRAAIGLQESWASNISDYILLRRQQTHSAYKVIDATVILIISKLIEKKTVTCLTLYLLCWRRI